MKRTEYSLFSITPLIVLCGMLLCVTMHAGSVCVIAQGENKAVVTVGRYKLQSNPWVNLHQRLLYEARFKWDKSPAGLSGDGVAKWKQAIDAYKLFIGNRHPIFDNELIRMNAELSATGGTKLPSTIPTAAAKVLETAMPLYRVAQWEEDDRANRFWIAIAEPLLASTAEELAAAHAKVYGVPFPTKIIVDVSPFAWQFGGYTVGEGDYAHTVISSTDAGYQGFSALEMLMHEPSHAIVDATSHAIGTDIVNLSKELGIKPPPNLWHAILFYTSGELTRRTLARRGVSNYQPVILGMYDRGFRNFRQPLEKHWQAYLDGKVSREAAIRQILIDTTPAKN